MEADDVNQQLIDWEVETSTRDEPKQEKTLCASQRRCYSLCRRKSFAGFVASKRVDHHKEEGASSWLCCGQTFKEHAAIHKHVARSHDSEIQQLTRDSYQRLVEQLEEEPEESKPHSETEPVDVSVWIPETRHISEELLHTGAGKVLLYYRYCQIDEPHVISSWQKTLCEKLHLTGKVRVATEGINGTVGGTNVATDLYMEAMRSHPLLRMETEDFKTSEGGAECFKELKVGVYKEIVPMGMDPEVISYQLAGVHLEPEEFHKEVETLLAEGDSCSDTVLLDCRNFYESKIGQFTQCLAPSIRKFSYFPDYVDQNLDLEQFPDGFYRGKLFVFDERYAISSNDDVISDCRYCGSPWDGYQLCSTRFCSQLVLSCPGCRQQGRTACCSTCQNKDQNQDQDQDQDQDQEACREECECTDRRPRIPQDV